MDLWDCEFRRRASLLRYHGIGLSVDAYSPDLLDLHRALVEAGLRPDYLELFKASAGELTRLREALPGTTFAYHAEGLWLIDPEMRSRYPWLPEIDRIARHAEILRAEWVNHECASKQFGGYAFGTYLPPLFIHAAADATAAHVVECQQRLDAWWERKALPAPLLLLELPPLTYFSFGDLSPCEFFALLAEKAPCGFVLDIGHLWTLWRYRERQRRVSLDRFVEEFLTRFPLDRVIQIHLAGLAPAHANEPDSGSPAWIDAHAAGVPDVLWDLLRRILADPRLTMLKGVALEVDTKAISVIVDEFRRLRQDAAADWLPDPARQHGIPPDLTHVRRCLQVPAPNELPELYRSFVRVVSGQEPLEHSRLVPLSDSLDRAGLHRYTTEYLPHELMIWGGDLEALFPKVWQTLRARGIGGEDFVRFWFQQSPDSQAGYDFFDMKLDRWAAFVRSVAPDLARETDEEARLLRVLHAEFNDEPKDQRDTVSA